MPLADAKYYRGRARELRELAGQLDDAERYELLVLAQKYDLLAEKAEKRCREAPEADKCPVGTAVRTKNERS